VFIIAFSVLWLCLEGILAIVPAATSALFGIRYYEPNYRVFFSARGVSAIIANIPDDQGIWFDELTGLDKLTNIQ
jgi:OFA family oxalate/formate antiporter-like MFS transporter